MPIGRIRRPGSEKRREIDSKRIHRWGTHSNPIEPPNSGVLTLSEIESPGYVIHNLVYGESPDVIAVTTKKRSARPPGQYNPNGMIPIAVV